MGSLEWSDTLLTGVDFIDESHRRIVDLIQRLSASGAGDGQPSPEASMALLTEYTGRHFQEEEDLMVFLDYPAMARHRAEHQRALAWMRLLQGQARQGLIEPKDIATFAEEFVADHILTQDVPFIQWTRSSRPAETLAKVASGREQLPARRREL